MGSPRRIGVLLLVALLAGLVSAACAGAPADQTASAPAKAKGDETIVWRMHQHSSAYGAAWTTYQYFASQVAYRTNGRLKIELNPGGTLGFKGTEVLRILKDGTVPIAELSPGYHTGEIPAIGVYEMPFITAASIDEWDRLIKVTLPVVSKELDEKWGTIPLVFAAFPGSSYFTSKPVAKVEDFKGLIIRTYSAETSDTVAALGASSVSLPIGEAYTALQRGTVNGIHTGISAVIGNKLYEVAKYYNRWDTHTAASVIAVGKAALDALPADIRKTVLEVAKDTQQFNVTLSNGAWVEDINMLKSQGGVEVLVAPEEREKARKLAVTVWDRWGERGGALSRQVLDLVKKELGSK